MKVINSHILIGNYINEFIKCDINTLDGEINYLKNKYRNIKSIYKKYKPRKDLIINILKCKYDEIEKYANDIKTYYKEYCDNNYDIEDLIIQYYECIFEYKEFYNTMNTLFERYNRIKYENFECEKLNKSLETINLDILIRQIVAIMKLKYEKIKLDLLK
jgi:hypothetical protein|tara:strand:+ start:545 stop:1024 length:480 start_codon:yes stop_codon:yes gene_type:complete